MLYRNRMISRKFIQEQGLRVEPPPTDSFFFRAFESNGQKAADSLNTNFIQGIKNGNLSPDYYGALTVLDAYYCYNGATSFQIAICNTDREKYPKLDAILTHLHENYKAYNQTFLNVWHLLNADCVVPTKTCKAYAEHERIVANYKNPVYTLVAILPCYYLWYWLSDQIYKYKGGNLYTYWIEGCHSAGSAYSIGNFIDEWQKTGNEFDEGTALDIYSESMKYEYLNFKEACITNELEGFFNGC